MPIRALAVLFVVILSGIPSLADTADEASMNPASWSCGMETLARTEPVTEPRGSEDRAVSCPCFDLTTLTALPGSSWDVCVESTLVAQAAAWFGRSHSEGREGYNVLVSLGSGRSPDASCQLLHRFRQEGEMEQDYRRIVAISQARATACRDILLAWLDSRGGCTTVVAGGD